MKYKMICIDLDGTLLDDKYEISEENKEVLREAWDKGIEIVLTTGRLFSSGRYYAHSIGITPWVISSNGAYIKNVKEGTIISNYPLNKEQLDSICNIIEKYDLEVNFNTFETVIAKNEFPEDNNHVLANKKAPEELKIKLGVSRDIKGIYDHYKEGILKILLIFENNMDLIPRVREELMSIGTVDVASSSKYNLEVMNKGISKAKGIETLARFLEISPEEIMCIGDSENDMSMLKYAGLAVAMGNAPEDVKSLADYVTDTNLNNGVAKAIRKHILE